MKLTDEQIKYLADFADKGITEQTEIAQRNADVQAAMEAQAARDLFIANLKMQKQQEVSAAVQDYDTKQNVPEEVATPVTLDISNIT